ncbi:phage baseplate assembly protein, partial [Stutzerimonas nitrititolerans]|uniref:phage baseplate assembly protein n=1 Tax=Stutzerimonas nitrititolerans TaxID=2482751 RepID=UPI00406CAEDF
QASGPRGTARDPRVRRPRTTLVVCDTPADSRDCAARAELEARMRWAKGRGVTYTVSGWRHEQGIWRPGDLVPVRDAYLGLDEPLLVSAVQLIDGLDGRRAEIRVVPPAAFEAIPIPEPEAASGSGKKPGDWGW